MENKNEKSMTLEEMIGEMLKDAKVVKVPLPVKAEEEKKAQKQDKPMPARPLGAPLLSINIENLHLHMDERMTSYNYGFGQEPDAEADDPAEDIDFDEMLDCIHKETGLCEKVILAVLKAQADYLDDLWGEEEENGEEENYEWKSIREFTGIFDGQNHTISDFVMTKVNDESIGFFQWLRSDPNETEKATLKNFTLNGTIVTIASFES